MTMSMENIPTYTPEKLNLWDRLFNRYRRVLHDRGAETWRASQHGVPIAGSEISRIWIEYRVIDRLTGSVTIERDYLN